MSRSAAEKTRNTQSTAWVCPWDQGWYNIRKVSRPFPLSSFDYYFIIHIVPSLSTVDYYFIMHIWTLSWCMSPASWNSWNLLSFIGLETSHRRGPEKRSIIDVISHVIDGVVKGLNFFHLWGEERALGLRTITTGQQFNQYACLVKPQWKSTNMGNQGAFGVVSHDSDVRVQCFLGHEGSSQLHFYFALHVSLIFAAVRFILNNNVRSICEWSSWVWSSNLLSYWTWSAVMLLPSFSYFVKSQLLHCHLNWGQFWALNMQNLY